MKLHEMFIKYEITEDGKVINKKLNREVSQRQSDFGYPVVCLSSNEGRPKFVKVHRLVASKYVPTDNEDLEVNHIDGNKKNNHYTNLEWVTSSENKAHAWREGLYTHKEDKHYAALLTSAQVHDMCKMLEDGCRVNEVAGLFGVSKDYVNNIRSGRAWKDISAQYQIKVQRKDRRSFHTIEKICRDIANGLTLDELCDRHPEVPRYDLRRILNKKIHEKISCQYF